MSNERNTDKTEQSAGPSAQVSGSAAYIPAQCLREEVERFKRTNRFTPMEVTGFYLQAAVVLYEHETMVKALQAIRNYYGGAGYIGSLAESALPPNSD